MSSPMKPRVKLLLMNCAVSAALLYRWLTGTALVPLVITGVLMFTLVNVLVIFTSKRSTSTNTEYK
ncbi:MAG: hypothetical protein JWQ42_940 [Edaphobacter sp.]|nr:hypothetical protein [Edaphobacter sp.]